MDQDGDMLVIDLDPSPEGAPGQVFKFLNSGGRRVIAGSYREWLSALASELAARRFRFTDHGGIWLDRLDLA